MIKACKEMISAWFECCAWSRLFRRSVVILLVAVAVVAAMTWEQRHEFHLPESMPELLRSQLSIRAFITGFAGVLAFVIADVSIHLFSTHLHRRLDRRLKGDPKHYENQHQEETIAFAIRALLFTSMDQPNLRWRERHQIGLWGFAASRRWHELEEHIRIDPLLRLFTPAGMVDSQRDPSEQLSVPAAYALLALLNRGTVDSSARAGQCASALLTNRLASFYREGLKLDAVEGGMAWVATLIDFAQRSRAEHKRIIESQAVLDQAVSHLVGGLHFVLYPALCLTEDNRLHFRQRRIELVGRPSELLKLRAFRDHEDQFRWWILSGPGGTGKSRLAHEFCCDCAAHNAGWAAGFVEDASNTNWLDWQPTQPTFLVVDYVLANLQGRWSEAIRHLGDRLNDPTHPLQFPVRLLLLDRPQSAEYWFHTFADSGGVAEATFHGKFRDHDGTAEVASLHLGGLEKEYILKIFVQVFEDPVIVNLAQIVKPLREFDWDDLYDKFHKLDDLGRPLFATMAAERLAATGEVERLERHDLTNWLLERFYRRWRECGVDEKHLRLLMLATMVGGIDLTDPKYVKIRDHQPHNLKSPGLLPASHDDNQCAHLAAISSCFNPRAPYMPPLEPDFLGGAFVLKMLAGDEYTTTENIYDRKMHASLLMQAAEREWR